MAFTENISFYLDPVNGFAREATVGGASVVGIFNEGSKQSLDVENSDPSFTCATADLSESINEGSIITYGGENFEVFDREDDMGMTTLLLRESLSPVVVSYYLRPDGVSRYLRPDGTSLYKIPA